MAPPHAPFRSADALREGWNTTKNNLPVLLKLGAIGVVLSLFHQALVAPGQHGLGPVLAFAVQVAHAALMMVYMRCALALASGRPIELSFRPELLSDFFGYLLTSVLYGLIVGAGLVLLLVPGVIWAVKFGFATFLVVDQRLDPIAALRGSARLTEGVKGALFRFGMLALGVNLVGALAFGVGLLVTVPTTLIAAAWVLRRLQEHAGLPVVHQAAGSEQSRPMKAQPEPERLEPSAILRGPNET